MSIRHLDALMSPRSIVVVGASDRPGSSGATVWRNLRTGAFEGPIHAVNPAHRTLDGERVFARCADLAAAPDLAIVCTPSDQVAGVIRDLGRLGTRAAVVTTAGMGEAQRRAVRDAARPHLLRLLGPGSLGILTPHLGLDASLAPVGALPGVLAFVSQSNTLTTTVLDWARSRAIGFSHAVALGEGEADSIDIDFGDMLDYLASDLHTRAILLHAESIASARKFMSAARAASRNKPVIIVKARRANALADAVADAALRRSGMLRVDTLDELFVAAEALARFHGDTAHGLTSLSNSHGAGTLATDAARHLGIACGAPTTVANDAPADRYADALRALLERPHDDTGTIVFMHAPNAAVHSADIARACLPVLQENTDRVLSCWLGDDSVAEARRLFESAGVADYRTPEQAVRAFDMIATYRRNQGVLLECPATADVPSRDVDAARRIVDAALSDGRDVLAGIEAKALLAAYDVPLAGVPETHEPRLVVRAQVDATFGPVILFGRFAAVDDGAADQAIALAPLNRVLARDLVSRTRVGKGMLQRDTEAAALETIGDILVAAAQVMANLATVVDLHIDLLCAADGAVRALEARVRIAESTGTGTDRFAILPYPSHLEEIVEWESTPLLLRPIRPEDEALHRDFIAHVSPADLRLRFFSSRRELPPSELARLVQIDYAREMAFVAIADAGTPQARTLGVVRAVSDPDDVEAEFAILTRSDLHGHGVGSRLMKKMVAYLTSHGTVRMIGDVLNENAPMHAFMLEHGFRMQPTCREPGVTHYELRLAADGAAVDGSPVRASPAATPGAATDQRA